MGLFKKNMMLVTGVISFALTIGCESKFNEQKPNGVESSDMMLQARVSANTTLDEKLMQLENSTAKVKDMISLIRKAAHKDDSSYTPIDLVLDLTRELKSGLPEGFDGHYMKQGQIKLPIASLTPECQMVDAQFKTLKDDAVDTISDKIVIDQTAVLRLKSCYSNGYTDVAEIHLIGGSLSFILKPDAFLQIFSGMIVFPPEVVKLVSKCSFANDESGHVTQASCSNIEVSLGSTESAIFENLSYDTSGAPRIEFSGKIYGSKGPKGSFSFKSKGDGTLPSVDLDKLQTSDTDDHS